MKSGQKLWSREELILAINLYCKLPFGKMHRSNPSVIKLAHLIGRTPSSVALKLGNLASLDPSLRARGIKGAENVSKLDKQVWEEFYNNWDTLPFESEKLLASYENTTVEELNRISKEDLTKEGVSKEALIRVRVNQAFFRKSILASYDYTCCITGCGQKELLVAGHIIPWSIDKANRLNPHNGLLLNALHDKAFDCGLITITPEYKVKISSQLKKKTNDKYIVDCFMKYDEKEIITPNKFFPDVMFLKYHNEYIFKM